MSWINAARKVYNRHQYAYVNDKGEECKEKDEGAMMLDAFTASMLVKIYDNLGEANQAKFAQMDLRQAVKIGWKVIK
jgi:hypothetical protein